MKNPPAGGGDPAGGGGRRKRAGGLPWPSSGSYHPSTMFSPLCTSSLMRSRLPSQSQRFILFLISTPTGSTLAMHGRVLAATH